MDGFQSPGAIGILYAEDFGIEPDPAPMLDPEPPPPPPPQLTQADIDLACAAAVEAAEAACFEGIEERRAAALEAIAAGLTTARREAEQQAEVLADGIARAALGMVAGILPDLSRKFGDNEVRALLARMLPTLARSKQVVVRTHPGLLEPLRTDLETLDETLMDHVTLRPASLPPGDVRLSWEDGSLVRDGAGICAAIEAGLAQLGLIDLIPSPQPTRSLALAQ